jgi:predicted transposase YdaD
MSILSGEWNLDDFIRVQRQEAREDGLEKGLEKTARNALAKGLSLSDISDITGLDTKTIIGFSAK